MNLLQHLEKDDQLFIQLGKREYLDTLLNGQLRITQQQYYKYTRGENGDFEEGKQLVRQNDNKVHLGGIESTYIWSCSHTNNQNIDQIKKFKDYDYGLLILEPIKFLSSLTECLEKDPILIKSAEIQHAKVLYTDDELIIKEDDRTPYNRWTKPLRYMTEYEYRLTIHNTLSPELINEFFNGKHNNRVEPINTPFNKKVFYRIICNFKFDSNFQTYVFKDQKWIRDYYKK